MLTNIARLLPPNTVCPGHRIGHFMPLPDVRDAPRVIDDIAVDFSYASRLFLPHDYDASCIFFDGTYIGDYASFSAAFSLVVVFWVCLLYTSDAADE